MRCSARSLGSANSSSARAGVLLGVCPRGRVPAIGWLTARPPVDRDEGLGAGPDDVEAVEAQQVHVRARVGGAQHPVDVQRRDVGGDLEALADHDLERLPGPDRLLRALHPLRRAARCCCAAGRPDPRPGRSPATVAGAGAASSAVIRSSRATASAHASSTRSSVSSQLIALAMSSTVPSAWSSTARSVTSIMASSGRSRSSSARVGSRSSRRTTS